MLTGMDAEITEDDVDSIIKMVKDLTNDESQMDNKLTVDGEN